MMLSITFTLSANAANNGKEIAIKETTNDNEVCLTLKTAESMLAERNLSLIAERCNVDMARAEIIQARLFDNPEISIEQNIYNRLNGKYFDVGKEGEAVIEIEQAIKLGGQRGKLIKMQKQNYRTAELQLEDALRILRNEVDENLISVYFLNKAVCVYDKEIESLKTMLNGIRQQEAKGNASRLETTRLETMVLSLMKEKKEQEDLLREAQGKLCTLLHIPAGTPIKAVIDETFIDNADITALSYYSLKSKLTNRPDIEKGESVIKASEANLRLQKSMALPDFSIKGSYDRAGNFCNNYFAIGVSLYVPIFDRNQGGIKAARSGIEQAKADKESAENQADIELYNACEALSKAVTLYKRMDKNVTTELETLLDGVNRNFGSRNISLLEFMDFYSSYREACLQIYDITKDMLLSMANLNAVMGYNVVDICGNKEI
ncbi:MAG: TolC family protein [Prevotellaceae bacterium]|nr:TolC family protein [Prevotellaceae bacterium]